MSITESESFKKSILSTCIILVTIFVLLMALTPLIPRYVTIFDRSFKAPHGLYDVDDFQSDYVITSGVPKHLTGFEMTSHKEWRAFQVVQGMRAWLRVNVELEPISDESLKNPEETISEGIGDKNDMALLLINMIYAISGEKVDLVLMEGSRSYSGHPMYHLMYNGIIYEVLNDRTYREKKIIRHISFDQLFSD